MRLLALAPLFLPWIAAAQPAIQNLQLASQAGNVLRYEATFQTTEPALAYLSVMQGGQSFNTSVSGPATEHVLPLYGLKENLPYQLVAHAFNTLGETSSMPVAFTTASVPTNIPKPIGVSNGLGNASDLVAINLPIGTHHFIEIYDRNGKLVWYQLVDSPASPCIGYYWTKNKTLLFLDDDCQTISEMDLAGNVLRTVDISGLPGGPFYFHHEFRLNDDDHLVALIAELRTIDQSSVGGPADAQIVGDGFLELDWDGNLLQYWTSFDHLDPLTATGSDGFWQFYFGPESNDWLHANSLMEDTDGHYLMSLSNPNQVIKIHRETGEIIWTLGDSGDFTISPTDARFRNQHSVSATGENRYLLFDNRGGIFYSRSTELEIDPVNMTATRIFTFDDGQETLTPVVGNALRLANGNTLTCFAQKGLIKESDPDGNEVWSLDLQLFSYRAYHFDKLYDDIPEAQLLVPGICLDDEPNAAPFYPEVEPSGGYFSGMHVVDGLFDPLAAGVGLHDVTYTYGWKSFPLQIAVSTTPDIPAIQETGDLLSTSGGYTYQWYLNSAPIPGAIDSFYVATQIGTYQVELFNQGGCSALSEPILIEVLPTRETPAQEALSIFPNPTGGWVRISSHNGPFLGRMQVFDVLGRRILDRTLEWEREWFVDLSACSSGPYFFLLENEKERIQQMIFLQK